VDVDSQLTILGISAYYHDSAAALLRDGRLLAAGPVRDTLVATSVSEAFGVEVAVGTDGSRWWSRVGDHLHDSDAGAPQPLQPPRPGGTASMWDS